ncbi:MAG: serine hydrolase domain-containing protein [Isosphaeraceae bacterium]
MDRSRATGRAVLIVIALCARAGLAPGRIAAQDLPKELPIAGVAGPGLEGLDEVVVESMRRLGIPGASLAVARNGSLVLAKGYGWADAKARVPAGPETLFALASVSKSLTAVTILKLVESGRLGLEARAFELLADIEPLPGDRVDPRVKRITVRHLLYHAGGWDRTKSGDPNGFSQRVAARMQVALPVSPRQLTRFMLGRPLDFDPGTQSRYSNFGYILLGLIIEKVAEVPYEQAVREITIAPLGPVKIRLNRVRGSGYLPNEAHRYLPSGQEEREGGHLPITMASGGWLATPRAMVRFLTAVDGSRGTRVLSEESFRAMTAAPPPPIPPRANGSHAGMGWDQVRTTPHGFSYRKNGGLPGVHSLIEHRDDGIDWALFWNGGRQAEDGTVAAPGQFADRVAEALTNVKTWPTVDFYNRLGSRDPRAQGD